MAIRHDPLDRDRWARLRFSIIGTCWPHHRSGGAARDFAGAEPQDLAPPSSDMPVSFGLLHDRALVSTRRRASLGSGGRAQDARARRLRAAARAGSARSSRRSPRSIAQHPSWSCQLHYDNLRRSPGRRDADAFLQHTQALHESAGSVRTGPCPRALHPWHARRQRAPAKSREVRSFELDHVNALWHLDFHHGSRKVLTRQGAWVTPMALAVLDDRSRLACHVQWYLDETAESLVHGFSQALQRRGLPRALMSDNGAAMMAEEFAAGLHHLGHRASDHAAVLPAAERQAGVFWGRVEGRLMAMLEGVGELTLELLNSATQAWVEQEYQRTEHSEIGCSTPGALSSPAPMCARMPRSQDTARGLPHGAHPHPARAAMAPSAWTAGASRFPRATGICNACICATRAGICAASILSTPAAAASCARSTRSTSPPTPVASAARSNRSAVARSADRLSPGIAPLLRKLMADYAATGLPPAYLPTDHDMSLSP